MPVTRSLVAALLTIVILGGCSGSPAPEPAKADPRPEVYEPVYRVATELRSAQEVGMNRQRFGELLEKFTTELSLARDKAETHKEQQVIQGYAEVLQMYKDAAAIWDVKNSIPELIDLADQKAGIDRSAGSIDTTVQVPVFSRALSAGIPMSLFTKESTGIDALVERYQIPITDSEGWKIIPNDSVERVWSRAREKTEEIVKLQKG
jgi:hypothetical protein